MPIDQRGVGWSKGAVTVAGEGLNREGSHRKQIVGVSHIGPHESELRTATRDSQSGTRAEPPSSSSPDETSSCVGKQCGQNLYDPSDI